MSMAETVWCDKTHRFVDVEPPPLRWRCTRCQGRMEHEARHEHHRQVCEGCSSLMASTCRGGRHVVRKSISEDGEGNSTGDVTRAMEEDR